MDKTYLKRKKGWWYLEGCCHRRGWYFFPIQARVSQECRESVPGLQGGIDGIVFAPAIRPMHEHARFVYALTLFANTLPLL